MTGGRRYGRRLSQAGRPLENGKSGCPFTCGVTSRDYPYGPKLVPGAVAGLRTVAVREIHEQMEEGDIRDIGAAICKVAQGMAGKP